jgi:hypothetical protein
VVIEGDRADETATAALRVARRGEQGLDEAARRGEGASAPVTFDFGPARREHELRWPPELQDRLIELLMSLPAPYRAYVRRAIHARAADRPAGKPLTSDDVGRLCDDLCASAGLRRTSASVRNVDGV